MVIVFHKVVVLQRIVDNRCQITEVSLQEVARL